MPGIRKRRVLPRGLKPVRKLLASGELRTYWYHRATGKRLKNDPSTAAGLLEVAAYDSEAAKIEAAGDRQAFADLWLDYTKSPEFQTLKPRTKRDYIAVKDWLGNAAAERMIVAAVTRQEALTLRGKAYDQRGRRFANYVVQVMRLVFAWGVERGWRKDNPWQGIKALPRPKDARKVNRAWRDEEVAAFFAAAPEQLRLPAALGLFAGMRQGDMLRLTWAAQQGNRLIWTAGKNAEPCEAPIDGPLRLFLAQAKRGDAVQVCLNSRGKPWTESGFRASFFGLIGKLKEAGKVQQGLTFHGLRHTVAAGARNEGASDFSVAAAIGDRSTAMAEVYGRDAERITAQVAVLSSTQKRFANVAMETNMETGSAPKRDKAGKPL